MKFVIPAFSAIALITSCGGPANETDRTDVDTSSNFNSVAPMDTSMNGRDTIGSSRDTSSYENQTNRPKNNQ